MKFNNINIYSSKKIAEIVNGKLIGNENLTVKNLAYDSRKHFSISDTLFIALKTANNDGHLYIENLIKKQHQLFLVDAFYDTSKFANATFIQVENTLEAFQKIAAFHRKSFEIPTIAITGSNGKTIVKEWIYHLLKNEFNICRSPASFNSQIGVPISVWQINKNNNLAIFEVGISENEEMDKLEQIVNPTIGVFTNLGDAHTNGFKSESNKLREKIKLFRQTEIIICNSKNKLVNRILDGINKIKFTWGFLDSDNFQILNINNDSVKNTTKLKCAFEKEELNFNLPFTDNASIENALTAITVCLYLKIDFETINNSLKSLPTLKLRLQMQPGINNSIIINDSYSNDYISFNNAIEFLNEQAQNKTKVLILSDFSGKTDAYNSLRTIAEALKSSNINQLLYVGEALNNVRLANVQLTTFKNTAALLENLNHYDLQNKAILIKGARAFKFEQIVNALALKNHQSKLYINLNALQNNINQYKKMLLPNTKIMVMVKSFAYGTGAIEIAKLLEYNNINYLAVAFVDEGIALRNGGINLPIMVMNHNKFQWQQMVENNLEPQIFEIEQLNNWLKFHSKKYHLKINTGMNRLGIDVSEIENCIEIIEANNKVLPASILSHLVESENVEDKSFTKNQIEEFKNSAAKIEEHFHQKIDKHILNSNGIKNYPQSQLEMVRLGIGLFGLNKENDFENVLALKSYITQIRAVKKGESIGYNRSFITENEMQIAIIGIGYADGLNRMLSNKNGNIFIQEQLAPIVGNVCMDMIMVDISNIENVKINDEVEIFGENISINTIAKTCKTIAYEVMTNISERVKRVYLKE